MFKKSQIPAVYLYSGLAASGTSMIISPTIKDLDGNVLTMNELGATPQVTVDPKVSGYEEIIGFSGVVDNGDNTMTITGLTRDLASSPLATPGTGKQHGAGATIVFSWNPQDVARVAALENDQTFSGKNTFSQSPTVPTPSAGTDVPNKDYVDGVVTQAVPDASTTVIGGSRLSYATSYSLTGNPTFSNGSPLVTLATHGLTLNDEVQFINNSGDTLPANFSKNQTYYVISTGLVAGAFELSLTKGGAAIVAGAGDAGTHVVNRTTPIAASNSDPRIPTQGENDALVGKSGTAPSTSNKFEDEADTSATSSAGKLVRANGSGLIDTGFLPAAQTTISLSSYYALQNITAGQAVIASYYQSDGGITFDNHNVASSPGGANPTVSFTVGNNGNRILLVFIFSTNTVTGVTYNGAGMTQVEDNLNGNHLYTYSLINPATGANNLVITSAGVLTIGIWSYYNVSQAGQPEVHTKTGTINTIANGALVVSACAASFSGPHMTTVTGAPNNFFIADASSQALGIGDGGILFYSPVTNTASANSTGGGGTSNQCTNQISLAPATSPTMNGIDIASSANDPSYLTYTFTKFKSKSFIGFAPSSITKGVQGAVITNGIATGLSGLIVGEQYYLADTPGTIGASAGTNSRKVGIALSTTTLLITNIW